MNLELSSAEMPLDPQTIEDVIAAVSGLPGLHFALCWARETGTDFEYLAALYCYDTDNGGLKQVQTTWGTFSGAVEAFVGLWRETERYRAAL